MGTTISKLMKKCQGITGENLSLDAYFSAKNVQGLIMHSLKELLSSCNSP